MASQPASGRLPANLGHSTWVHKSLTMSQVFCCERTLGTRVCQATIGVKIDDGTYWFSQYEVTTQWELHSQALYFVRKFNVNRQQNSYPSCSIRTSRK
ncbi:hypothetical protein BLAT2472_20086 [Burkholderia latens]